MILQNAECLAGIGRYLGRRQLLAIECGQQVSRSATQLLYFMKKILESRPSNRPGDLSFSLEIPVADFNAVSRRRPRKGIVQVSYPIDEPWKLMKQVLIDTAKPMPGFKPQDIGAEFASPILSMLSLDISSWGNWKRWC